MSIMSWLVQLPRLVRIGIVAVITLAVTAVLFPLVDNIYIRWMYTRETIILPSLVSVGVGLLMYVIGWRWLVGTIGEDIHPGPVLVWYLGVGMVAFIMVCSLILQGIAMTDAVAG